MQSRDDPSFFETDSTSEAHSDVVGSMALAFSCFRISSSPSSRALGPTWEGVSESGAYRASNQYDIWRRRCVHVFHSTYSQKKEASSLCCRDILRLRPETLVNLVRDCWTSRRLAFTFFNHSQYLPCRLFWGQHENRWYLCHDDYLISRNYFLFPGKTSHNDGEGLVAIDISNSASNAAFQAIPGGYVGRNKNQAFSIRLYRDHGLTK